MKSQGVEPAAFASAASAAMTAPPARPRVARRQATPARRASRSRCDLWERDMLEIVRSALRRPAAARLKFTRPRPKAGEVWPGTYAGAVAWDNFNAARLPAWLSLIVRTVRRPRLLPARPS